MIDLSRFRNEPAPGYDGPIRWLEPTGCQGRADLFCPECGSTGVEALDAGRGLYGCNSCGRRFRLDTSMDGSKRFSVRSAGSYRKNGVAQDGLWDGIWDVADEDYGDGEEYIYDLASRYYGDAYPDLVRSYYEDGIGDVEDEEYIDAIASGPVIVPARFMVDNGYFGGLEIGESAKIPGTPIRVTRTKNLKDGRARRRAFGRR